MTTLLLTPLWGCTADVDKTDSIESTTDIEHIDLHLNLPTLDGTATLTFVTVESPLELHAEGLVILSVRQNTTLDFTQDQSLLTIEHVEPNQPVHIDYRFESWSLYDFVGWMPEQGISFTWPYHCGYLFPCNPEVSDGATFSASITGNDNETLIYPSEIISPAPIYMFGLAQGTYDTLEVGETTHGTTISAWYFPENNGIDDAIMGTQNLVASVQYLEDNIGPYTFGSKMASVEVDWGNDSYGGMEHHPFFHVGQYDFWNEEAQVHEAVHGWFGNSVRLRCWEDFVLSEGTTTYLTAKALEANTNYDIWAYYVDEFLTPICEGEDVNAIVHPTGCGQIDFENSNVWSLASYMKGACFFKEVENIIGNDNTLERLSSFYQSHRNQAATLEEMIDHIMDVADANEQIQIETLQEIWLEQQACPSDYVLRCR